MNEQLPSPDFDAQSYSRPNQKWICGHACEGQPCRQGPDEKGRCRATAECKPVLETRPGETKGRWRCTRSDGACESGPLPDGSCCRPVAKCSPVPTLRVWRGRTTLAIVAISCAMLLILLGNPPWRNKFIIPGEISSAHSGDAFAALAKTHGLNQNCGACHVAGNSGPHGIVKAAMRANPGFFAIQQFMTASGGGVTAIDESCGKCHVAHDFHHPKATEISCTFCHAEHHGKMIAATTDANCDFCHSDAAKMSFARTENNVPAVIHHFADDHPQFRFITEKLRDQDTLKFNHALHLTGATIPNLPGGAKLDCAFCHQPDAAGAFMKPVNFENNCRVCHSLQFDPATPQLTLPHGNAELVSAFLRSLPKQYSDLAAQENQLDANDFVRKKLAGLRAQFGSGEDLEGQIFFSSAATGAGMQIGTLSGSARALFPGCALCHEVKNLSAGQPEITKPAMPEHWLVQAKFNHAKHTGISCATCHDAIHSRDTADILLPAKDTCATCHSPRGGVVDTCATCHTFHNPQIAAQ
ncbi:MAG TPA: cytochrome c3 family protein [Verrucomicrobiae bacterium]|jgi:hypothetical protein|nr:cytochrome c3 family protein [Verrucomicrobiae bacterium]